MRSPVFMHILHENRKSGLNKTNRKREGREFTLKFLWETPKATLAERGNPSEKTAGEGEASLLWRGENARSGSPFTLAKVSSKDNVSHTPGM